MKDVIEVIDGLIKTVNEEKQRTPFLAIAAGRLEAAKGRLVEHLDELGRQEKAKAELVSQKEAELAKLKGGETTAATAE